MQLLSGGPPPLASITIRSQIWRDPTGAIWAEVVDGGDEVRIEFPRFGVATILRSTGEVVGFPAAGVDASAFRARIEKEAYPVLYQALGLVSLHASAVAVGDRAVALIGPTHAGKSTFAHAWHRVDTHARVIADDALVVDPADQFRVRELPFVPSLRSEARARFGMEPEGALARVEGREGSPVRLVGAFLLERGLGAAPVVSAVAPARAVLQLLPEAYCFLLADSSAARSFYGSMLELVSRVPIRRLRYPDDFARLPLTVEVAAAEAACWA